MEEELEAMYEQDPRTDELILTQKEIRDLYPILGILSKFKNLSWVCLLI